MIQQTLKAKIYINQKLKLHLQRKSLFSVPDIYFSSLVHLHLAPSDGNFQHQPCIKLYRKKGTTSLLHLLSLQQIGDREWSISHLSNRMTLVADAETNASVQMNRWPSPDHIQFLEAETIEMVRTKGGHQERQCGPSWEFSDLCQSYASCKDFNEINTSGVWTRKARQKGKCDS